MKQYDAIVLGLGGVGSAAFYHLACSGISVLGLEQFDLAHDQGSSHGQTRAIRLAYFEHPDYVPLLREAYKGWAEFEKQTGKKLYHQTGLIQSGPRSGEIISGVLQATKQHDLQISELSHDDATSRFSGLNFPTDHTFLFEQDAGFLRVEECVQAFCEEGTKHGGEIKTQTRVVSYQKTASGFEVQTSEGVFQAKKLVVTAGAWSSGILKDLGLPLQVLRKSLFWYATAQESYKEANGFPVFVFERPEGIFYGFPDFENSGLKVAEHTGGVILGKPEDVDRDVDPAEQQRIENFLEHQFKAKDLRFEDHATCYYTMTPDGHFVVDTHPNDKDLIFCAGLSGHGFKFTGVLGRALKDLVVSEKTDLPIEFFNASRLVDQ